jgi:signal transduction histidine kinase
MRQVFLNMISNAKDAMPGGGELTFKSYQKNGTVFVEIADTGHGIDEENISRIFDTFFTTKDSVKGVGLGLSVCYGFIRDHGGDIKVRSKPAAGTTFTINLPAYPSKEAAGGPRGHSATESGDFRTDRFQPPDSVLEP